ncbi:MAG TPA: PTS sugar transporter subunit IIA, partial [Stellaceae bacterium]|nr:PTS sugar transporter subunit IIA [Stellaceae bacterium]
VIASLQAADKEQVLDQLSARAASLLGLDAGCIREALAARERLGSTSLGRGIAMPHARLASVERVFLLLARLDRPIEFGGDDPPVDLVFLLLAPQAAGCEYLHMLAALAKSLRDGTTACRLRAAKDQAELGRVLAGMAPAATRRIPV